MEKKSELLNLNNLSYQYLVWRIVGAARRTAHSIPAFRDSHNGCVRITIVPLSQDADVWLGGLSDFGELTGADVADICEREFVFKIDPHGSYTIQYVCEDGHTEPVNCYGYSALKTAFARWHQEFEATVRRENLGETFADFQYRQHTQFFSEDNGWSTHSGSACATLTLDGEDFAHISICTSGADSSEDMECSLAGMLAAQEFFEKFTWAKFNPYIDGMKSPLEQVWRD